MVLCSRLHRVRSSPDSEILSVKYECTGECRPPIWLQRQVHISWSPVVDGSRLGTWHSPYSSKLQVPRYPYLDGRGGEGEDIIAYPRRRSGLHGVWGDSACAGRGPSRTCSVAKAPGSTPAMLETAQHRSSGGLPSGSESKQRCVKRQVDGGMEQGQGHASCGFAGVLQGGAMTAANAWRNGGGEEMKTFSAPPKNHCFCIRLPFVCDCLFLTTSSPLRGPCPGLCRPDFAGGVGCSGWWKNEWNGQTVVGFSEKVGEMPPSAPPPGGPDTTRSLPFCF